MSNDVVKLLHKADLNSTVLGSHSGVANFLNPGGRVLTNLSEGKALTGRSLLDPAAAYLQDPAKPPPAPPTIDDARRNLDDSDRLRKRRGLFANIFAGNAGAPTVGKATLGG